MSRNVNSYFSENPSVNIGRSKFIRPQEIKTSLNAAELVPFYIDEVLPGDSHSIDSSRVIRMSTPITPIMDNIFLDTYFFFVPSRLVWTHWKQFMGENTDSAWIPQVHYSVPQLEAPENGWECGTIADYFGIPTKVDGISVNALPFRMYAMICNEWFRDENLTDPLYYSDGDATVVGTNGTNYRSDCAKGGYPFKVAKYRDYFTSALPSPQKGEDVQIPLRGQAAVTTTGNFTYSGGEKWPLYWGHADGATEFPESYSGTLFASNKTLGVTDYASSHVANTSSAPTTQNTVIPINLIADLNSSTGVYGSINELRTAFQIQKFFEKEARAGSRYTEVIRAHFGTVSPDSRLQRPEYLGGNRIPININQVIQQSETSATSPLGDTGAYSLTIDSHSEFTKSFTEHGFIIGLMCVRYEHTYQQGIERMWSRTLKEHYYWPVFANLGEQAIKNKEIYAQGTNADDEVFGYAEAWAEYRYKPNRVSGMMRSNYATSLDIWHLADDYASLPSLSDAWIREDKANIDRVLAVTSAISHQFIADIYVRNKTVRAMPLYSIPGLIDHH